MSHNVTMDSENLFAPPLNDWRSERAPPNIIFLNFHHISSYPPCTHTAVSQLYMDNVGYSFTHHSIAMDKSRMVSCWFSKTSSTTCALFLICRAERGNHDGCQSTLELSGTLFLNDEVSVHHHQTPALTGSEFQGWKCSAYTKLCHTTKFSARQSFHYHYNCT